MTEFQHKGVSIRDGAPGRGSGRYPLGSGEHPFQSLDTGFLDFVRKLKTKGLSDKEIVDSLGLKTVDQLKAYKSIAKDNQRIADREKAIHLRDVEGLNTSEIGRRMGKAESTIRSLFDEERSIRTNTTKQIANTLKDYVDKNKYVYVGPGTELELGITSTKLKTAISMLEYEGYNKYLLKEPQIGTDNKTNLTILCPPDVSFKEMAQNKGDIKIINEKQIDVDGSTLLGMAPLKDIKASSIDPKRIEVVYKEQGGGDMEGVVELRRGVDDISLGKATYAQVRIPIDETHYFKGMAVYADDLPPGIDLRINTNKKEGTPLLVKGDKDAPQVLKPMKEDKDNPFGATIKREEELKLCQKYYKDKDGNKKLSAINVVMEEGDWGTWSKSLASQMLSKQSPELVKKQLKLALADKMDEYDTISKLTNPSVKKLLLEKFGDTCDSAAVDLKAAALPGQQSKVILPVRNLKGTEIYAPHLKDGEEVVLIRYPHGGQFEIPRLTVNNSNRTAKKLIGNAMDAVGISSSVAGQLSGADFDGDTVLVIPTTRNGKKTVNINTMKPIEELSNFDTKTYYKEGFNVKNKTKQTEMGKVTNLIADMTLKGASLDEIVRATKHSMVIIDSEKHHLDYKQSELDNDIRSLKKTYQNGGGASTIITRASSQKRVTHRKEAYKPDAETGERVFIDTPEFYVNKKGKLVERQTKTTAMFEAKDAFDLVGDKSNKIEVAYATYANSLKALANKSRKDAMSIKETKRNPSAAKVYSDEVKSLQAKLVLSQKNKPKENKAQILANQVVAAKRRDNPEMDNDTYKKIKGQAITEARARMGASKPKVSFTPKEWEAVQAGAIGSTNLKKLLNNADLDQVKELAMPRSAKTTISQSQISRMRAMSSSGYTIQEIAEIMGFSPSSVSKNLK